MFTRKLIRENEMILISDYGFEWYVDNELVRAGLTENADEDIAMLIEEGFELVD